MDIEAIISDLTLEEKASLTTGSAFWYTQPIEGKVPAIMMTDGPHGLRKQEGEADMLGINVSVPATCFPSGATVCNSWDTDLIFRIGEALGEECQNHDVQVLLGPGVNMKRSPLCGRNFEYFSEDPYLSSHMAAGHINGVQSKGVGACIKHFAVNNQETCRYSLNAIADERTLREIYLASFEEAIRTARPWMVMTAYNKVNGDYCSEHPHLLEDILRKEWGYDGVVVSDWGAANDPVRGVEAGFDLRMPGPVPCADEAIVEAVQNGALSQEKLDACVRRVLTLVKKGIEHRRSPEAVHSSGEMFAEHHALALKAAAESAVLLKNTDNILPLQNGQRLAVIGGFAKNTRYQGGGSSNVNATKSLNLLEALAEAGVNDTFARGFRNKVDVVDEDYVQEALDACCDAEVILLNLGLPFRVESEGFDRKDMTLPHNQIDLLNRLSTLGKPIIVLLSLGAPVEAPWADKAAAILAMYTGGQAVAEATVRLLYGEANPCGKLAETWPCKLEDNPSALNYPQKDTAVYEEGVYIGYRYYEKKKLPVQYPFGYGLSYTNFRYDGLQLERAEVTDRETVSLSLNVTNAGAVAGREIVQLYVRPVSPSVSRPVKELKGFRKTRLLQPGETETVRFALDGRSFAYYNTSISDWFVESGRYDLLVGASSADIRQSATLFVTGTKQIKPVYTAESRIGDLLADPKAAQLIGMIAGGQMGGMDNSQATQNSGFPDEDAEDAAMDSGALGQDMPLGKLVNFSGGRLSFDKLNMLLGMLNQ
ncbi:MAG: glycoside hydrolase family 3 C-terminal domain-containing protein [Clostridiales bacterium]|nr:glycoside hydrolase family 3 C-terminal domain-containing protein [Clostridiales bacterium]